MDAMRRHVRWICWVLALGLLLSGCAAQPEQTQQADEPVLEQAAPEEPAAQPEPEAEQPPVVYAHHAPYMRAAGGFFRPDAPLRRADAAQLLCNLTQRPAGTDCRYDDVDPESWYYGAVCAAEDWFPADMTVFSPMQPITEAEFCAALALALPDADVPQPEEQAAEPEEPAPEQNGDAAQTPEEPAALTRAQAAVLVNRALGRVPDTEAVKALPFAVLLDVPEEDPAYADVLEAVLPHDNLEEDGERWYSETLPIRKLRAGVHTQNGIGYVVDEDGAVIRREGLFRFRDRSYLSADGTGCIYADGAPHFTDGKTVWALRGGALLQGGSRSESFFDEDGFYTTGSDALDLALDEVLAACTTEDMTQEECLRACYDYVRDFGYLGRNAAYGPEVRTIPYDAQIQFAEKIFSTGKGDCYNFTAAFCFLARRLGYEAQAIVGECGYVWNWRPIAHGWVELACGGQTLVYDPQIENYNLRAGISNETSGAFGVSYETAHARYQKH